MDDFKSEIIENNEQTPKRMIIIVSLIFNSMSNKLQAQSFARVQQQNRISIKDILNHSSKILFAINKLALYYRSMKAIDEKSLMCR